MVFDGRENNTLMQVMHGYFQFQKIGLELE